MSKPVDYSKWDNIELSDDEDDVHPNIEKESWFRLKHRSRVEREEKEEADKKRIRSEMNATDLRIKEITRTLKTIADSGSNDESDEELEDKEGLEAELSELVRANETGQRKLDEFEKNKKWNVDNMSRVVEERTIVNPNSTLKFSESGYVVPDEAIDGLQLQDKGEKVDAKELSENADEPKKLVDSTSANSVTMKKITKPAVAASATPVDKKSIPAPKPTAGPAHAAVSMMSYHDFTEKYADTCEKFMAIRDLDKCRDFLVQNGNIMLQENASNYLLLASLEDEMNGYREKMKLTARQSQIISNIAEMAKSLRSHPGNVILPFFKRLEQKEIYDGFMDGVESFIGNIIKRAVVKRKEMDAEIDTKEGTAVDLATVPKEERLGPGGLDPVEVFDTLPVSMQKAFESRDTNKLKEALLALDPSEAELHMKRCIDSGLWNEG